MIVFLHIKRDLCETSVLPYLQASTTVSVILTREIISHKPLNDTSIKRGTTLFKCINRIP